MKTALGSVVLWAERIAVLLAAALCFVIVGRVRGVVAGSRLAGPGRVALDPPEVGMYSPRSLRRESAERHQRPSATTSPGLEVADTCPRRDACPGIHDHAIVGSRDHRVQVKLCQLREVHGEG